MKKQIIAIIIIILFLLGCTPKAEKTTKTIKEPSPLEIYLAKPIKDGQHLNSVELQEQPILTLEDIKSYSYESHTIELTEEYISKRQRELAGKDYDGSKVLGTRVNDIFVLVVNGKKISSGGFRPFILNNLRLPESTPNIIDTSNNKIKIDFHPLSSFRLHDPRLYDVLKGHGKLIEKNNSSLNDKTLKEAVSSYAMTSSTRKYYSKFGIWSTTPLETIRIYETYVVFAKDVADITSYSLYTLQEKKGSLSLASAVNSPFEPTTAVLASIRETEVQIEGKPCKIIYGMINPKFIEQKKKDSPSATPTTLRIITDSSQQDDSIYKKKFFIVPANNKEILDIQILDQRDQHLGSLKKDYLLDYKKH